MPIYSFMNSETKEVIDLQLKLAERETYLKENPHMVQVITSAPTLGDSVRMGIRKTDDNFNSLLKHIKKGTSTRKNESTIKTR